MVDRARRSLAGEIASLGRARDKSGPREPYFVAMQAALTRADVVTPTLVIDRGRLNANIDALRAHLPPGMGYRIVVKSLPCLRLLAHIRERARTDRLMTFNLPMLLAVSQAMPEADQLLGKPLSAAAARAYLEQLPAESAAAAANIQWLVDTPERLRQYAQLATAFGCQMQINIELDIGLRRGGYEPGSSLTAALDFIKRNRRLSFSGFMGYEPHIAKIPEALGWRRRALDSAWSKYKAALDAACGIFDSKVVSKITRNAAGSPTYRLYRDTRVANEVSVGSVLVKPTDFDTDLLAVHQPAAFIATPIVKVLPEVRTPGVEFTDVLRRAWDPNHGQAIFIHGGHWMASPVDPPGLRFNALFGRSSNQEMLTCGRRTSVTPDDFVFFRPNQSEAVFLQFGDIAVFDNGAIVAHWPVFPASA